MNRIVKKSFCLLAVFASFCFAQNTTTCFDGRPLYHFTPPQNWTNDPNGLLYANGQYHLFYQHNPFGMTWGHMTWAHAVSRDLLTWQHLPIAIPEDSMMIFSGSAVNDSLNTSGLGDENGCLVAIYTEHGNAHQTQGIAYSVDDGETWTKYAGNPVIDRNMADFRDPNVFWYAPERKWIMVVALPKDYKIAFYSSPNLIDWQLMSEFGPEGKAAGLWECPDLFEMPVQNSNKRKWVLMLSSEGPFAGYGGMQYFVGEFDGTTFVNDNPAEQVLYMDFGKDFYAGQTYSGLPIDRHILISWLDNWAYANDTPEKIFRGRMTLPRQLELVETEFGVRLKQSPVSLQAMSTPLLAKKNISAEKLNTLLTDAPESKAYSLKITAKSSFTLKNKNATLLIFDKSAQQIIINRAYAQNCFGHKSYALADTIAIENMKSPQQFDFYFDANSMELFIEDGLQTISYLLFPGVRLNEMSVEVDGKVLAGIAIFE